MARQGDDENKSRRALAVLAKLNRRNVWLHERTPNAICNACFTNLLGTLLFLPLQFSEVLHVKLLGVG